MTPDEARAKEEHERSVEALDGWACYWVQWRTKVAPGILFHAPEMYGGVELTPTEARAIATALTEAADAMEARA